ncbi:glycosyltransferase [Candidatus Parcubacteria bacterium]|nr:MAG: glycosyltransferase [Candidatus Parcubacteria bacterium]
MATKFTLVIPAYNEASIIRETIKTICDAFAALCPCPWHVIVADNASTDHTADLVDAMNDSRVSTVRLKEKGRGRAIREAFRSAGGGVVAFTDADLPISPEEIVQGLRMILGSECEVVVGTRFAVKSAAQERSFLRNGSSMIFLMLARMITGLRASDSQCPLKMMNERTTPIMLETEDPTWWSELEFLLLVERLGIAVKELPITWHDRYPERKSTVKMVSDSLRAIQEMVKMRFHLAKKLEALRVQLHQPT